MLRMLGARDENLTISLRIADVQAATPLPVDNSEYSRMPRLRKANWHELCARVRLILSLSGGPR
jgi:hypothetical protein